MSYYTQPAAANYNTAPLHNERHRGYRICDQCGTVETSAVKFRLCGGCVRSFNILHTSIVANTDCFNYNLDDHTVLCMFSSIVLPPWFSCWLNSFPVSRLSKNSLAIPQTNLPTHRLTIKASVSKCRCSRICGRESCKDTSEIHFCSHGIAWMDWFSSPSTEACPC